MLGQYLKTYRIKNNLTQVQMAKKLGTSQSYYSMIESNRKKPGFITINRIANLLDTDPSFIRSML